MDTPKIINDVIKMIDEKHDKDTAKLFKTGILNTLKTTISYENGETFIITGDISAMWNRDSVAQIRPLLLFCNQDIEIKKIIKGLIKTQKKQILIDQYANAFNKSPSDKEIDSDDITKLNSMVWERKYEIDSLCYPIELCYNYYKITKDESIFDDEFLKVAKVIVETFCIEQNHFEKSDYSFRRIADWLLFDEPERIKYETLYNKGMGTKVSYTGMTWSGFRPSDDACQLGYLVPSNMFAVVILKYLKELMKFYDDQVFLNKINILCQEIEAGINKYAIIEHEEFGKVYAYEVDGLGNHLLMDDANVPSLLSLPYIGYCEKDDPIYLNTRKMILSMENEFYYEGSVLKGIGSPHTPKNYVWHIALAIQAMTCTSTKEKEEILEMFLSSHANQFMMHEGIHVDDERLYTRPWFSWANSMFAEFLLDLESINIKSVIKENNEL